MQLCARSPSPRRPGRRRRRRRCCALALVGSLLGPAAGRAQPAAPIARPEPAARDVAGAPPPGRESGRLDPGGGGDSSLRLVGRGILLLPRVAFQIVMAPVRGAIWANERYRLYDRAYELLFNEEGTFGVYPTVWLDSDFGLTAGARLVHRDLFGARERVSLSAEGGGRYRERLAASLRTGDRLGGRLQLGIRGEYDRQPKERFYGIGNGDEVEPPVGVVLAPLDPRVDPTAIETRYRQRLARATAVAEVRVAGPLSVIGSAALTDLEVARSDRGAPIDEIYRPAALVGWDGVRHAYTELELRWDSRRSASWWEPRGLASTGWLAAVYGGRVSPLDGGADYWRYGGDLQRFLRIGPGPRVLAARAHLEAVSGSRDEVPFFELPSLGGSRFLRGYSTERFHDRIAALVSLDYQWDLSQMFAARVFVDAGRVYESLDDLELDGLRVGFGLGLEASTRSTFRVRTAVATSIDGGVHFILSFSPVFDLDGRVERR